MSFYLMKMITQNYRKAFSTKVSWLLLAAFLLMGLLLVGMVMLVITGGHTEMTKEQTAISSVLQNIIAFIVPAVAVALLSKMVDGVGLWHRLRLDKAPALKWVAVIIVIYFVALPAMNWITMWNEGLRLPASMQGIEETFRAAEDKAQEITTQMLQFGSLLNMLVMLMIVAVITALGEELFFRSALLGSALDRHPRRAHLLVWTVAIIFSAFHFQFYGFVPRMLLGAWFGYLMLWSGSVWVPIIAHAFNNGMVVVVSYLVEEKIFSDNKLDTIGTTDDASFPWLALASAVVTITLVILVYRTMRSTPPPYNPELTDD